MTISIYDPYLVIPGYGENNIGLNFIKGNLNLKIFYDCLQDDSQKVIDITFINVCYHKCCNFPGVNDSNYINQRYSDITSLVEFENSELKNLWELHFNHVFKFRHFKIIFTNANYVLDVICQELILP